MFVFATHCACQHGNKCELQGINTMSLQQMLMGGQPDNTTGAGTFNLEASPEVFNAVMGDFLVKLQEAFPHRKADLQKAKQRMEYLTAVNAGAVMNYFKNAMQPFEAAICQLDTGFLITGLPEIRLLQGKVSQQDLVNARPEDRVMCSNFLRDLYLLSVGPQALPQEVMSEVDRIVGALTDDTEALKALESAFENVTAGQAPTEADMERLQKVMKEHGLPGLPQH